jgi:hypothetical protein
LEKSEILRNDRIAAKSEEIRKMKIDSNELSKDMTVEVPNTKITIKTAIIFIYKIECR